MEATHAMEPANVRASAQPSHRVGTAPLESAQAMDLERVVESSRHRAIAPPLR